MTTLSVTLTYKQYIQVIRALAASSGTLRLPEVVSDDVDAAIEMLESLEILNASDVVTDKDALDIAFE